MSKRTTAEIVADLRAHHAWRDESDIRAYITAAADRLAELDAKVADVNAALDQYDESADGEELRSTLAALFEYPVNSKRLNPGDENRDQRVETQTAIHALQDCGGAECTVFGCTWPRNQPPDRATE